MCRLGSMPSADVVMELRGGKHTANILTLLAVKPHSNLGHLIAWWTGQYRYMILSLAVHIPALSQAFASSCSGNAVKRSLILC